MSRTLEFVFDVGSPYSYLASSQLAGLSERTGCVVELAPVSLGGIFKSTGAAQAPPPSRLAWVMRDLVTWAERYRVPLEFPASFPTRTLLAQRALLAAGSGAPMERAMHALFRAYWGEGRDVSEKPVVQAALSGAGLDGAALVARTEEPAIKEELIARTARALSRGVFGVPTFFVGDKLFWGNDRLEFVEAALRS
jgi:2-hydroxychromene-2-carboxylate isomerase